jgi:two-component system phosphate regulon sensor histidine kinase PhoR
MKGRLRRRVFLQCLITMLVVLGILGIIEYVLVLENRLWAFLFVGIASAAFVAWYLTVRLEQEILDPIREMTKVTRQLTGRQIRFPLPDEYVDELALLGKTLSEMGTRIKRNISEITEEKNKIRAIIECMAEGVIALDKKGRVALLNPAAEAMFHLPGTQLLEKPFLQVVRNYQLAQAFQEALERGEGVIRKVELVIPEARVLRIEITPLKDERAEVLGVVGVLHDISELTKVERMRTDFIANVSHELRTPLTSIKGFVETLLEGAMDDPAASRRFLEIINTESNRLAQLINDLLSLSEIESKRKPFVWEEFSLVELIHEILNIFNIPLEKKELQLRLILPEDLPQIVADRGKIGQVLINLIDNAIKYTPGGQTVTISTWQERESMVICVADTGTGIPREALPRLFERFYRVDTARSREMGGTGLGLAIVKHIVEAHRGRVWVTSELGQGSSFYFSLPVAVRHRDF